MTTKHTIRGKASAKPTTKGKGKVTVTARALSAKRERANLRNTKRRVKPHHTDSGADYLDQAIALVLAKRPAKGAPARQWAVTNPSECVTIDARKVVRKVKGDLFKRPENTIRARLMSMTTYATQVGGVGYVRYLMNTKGNPAIVKGNPEAYLVVLYRK